MTKLHFITSKLTRKNDEHRISISKDEQKSAIIIGVNTPMIPTIVASIKASRVMFLKLSEKKAEKRKKHVFSSLCFLFVSFVFYLYFLLCHQFYGIPVFLFA